MDADTWVLLGDASNQTNVDAIRTKALQFLQEIRQPAEMFILTPQLQEKVASRIEHNTRLPRPVVEAALTLTGYASQRQKLDIVAAGFALQNGGVRTLTLDDDVVIPDKTRQLKSSVLAQLGLTNIPNSQAILRDFQIEETMFDLHENSIQPFFQHLGRQISQIRVASPLPTSKGWTDTMHTMLEQALKQDRPVQFVVTHTGEEMPSANDATVIAVAATKSFIPDYRTVRIAATTLLEEFPSQEAPVQAHRSGPTEQFAFMGCRTNVDSACFARILNQRTAFLSWWFVSSDSISRANPLQTVTGHYRADNELLPVLLETIYERTGEPYMYLSGIETYIEHHRARIGYRPDIHEQATASLVGNIAALEAAKLLEFDQDGRVHMRKVENNYRAPQEGAEKVFTEMCNLAHICSDKITELTARNTSAVEEAMINEKIQRYSDMYSAIQKKLGNFNFDLFYQHLNTEIRDQLNFFASVVEALPTIIEEVFEIIKRGQYPVLSVVRNDITTSYPKVGHKRSEENQTIYTNV